MTRPHPKHGSSASDKTIGETAVVAALTTVGIVAATAGGAFVWELIVTTPIVAHLLALGAGIALAVGVAGGVAMLGWATVQAVRTRPRPTDVDDCSRPGCATTADD